MKGKYKLKKYNMGTQSVDTPNYNSIYNKQAEKEGTNQAITGAASSAANMALPGSGSLVQGAGMLGDLVAGKDDKGVTTNTRAALGAALNPLSGYQGAVNAAKEGNYGRAAIQGASQFLPGVGIAVNAAYAVKDNKRAEKAVANVDDRFRFMKKSNNFAVDPNAMKSGDTGVANLLPMAKNGMQVGKYKYKNGTSGVNTDSTKVNTLEGDLYSKVIMNRNKNKDFVQRANALGDYPESNMFQEFADFDTKQSHRMSWGEDEKGQAYMFPTIMNKKNEAVKVPNQYADYISSEGYKKASGMKYKNGTKGISLAKTIKKNNL